MRHGREVRATVSRGGFFVGGKSPAVGNAAFVGVDSRLVVTNADNMQIGCSGANSSLTVSGGRLEALGAAKVIVGGQLGGSNSTLVVENGAVADVHRLIIGDKAPNCAFVISNATLNVVGGTTGYAGHLQAGYSAVEENSDPSGATVTIAGRTARVNVASHVSLKNATAKIRFAIPAEGFAQTPLAVSGSFETVVPGATIEVTADPDWPVGSRVTLVEAKSSGQMGNLKLVGGDNLKVYRSGNAIMVKKLGGMCMILR